VFTDVNICCVEVTIYLEELCGESGDGVHLAQDKDLWWVVNESRNEPLYSMNTKLVSFGVVTVVLLEGSSLLGCASSASTSQKI
jgi:hypothetical protein